MNKLIYALSITALFAVFNAASAATISGITSVTEEAYQWVNDANDFSNTSFVDKAWYFSGNVPESGGSFDIAFLTFQLDSANLAADDGFDFSSLNTLGLNSIYDPTGTVYEDAKAGTFTTIDGELMTAVLLKAGDINLFTIFSYAVNEFYFNTLFAPNNAGTNSKGLSHFVMGQIPAVPIPAAAFLFTPAIFGLIALRRKYKLI